jgi:coenzyme F420-0:L-glutamate ligase/coenzyme F420-1:gamma-L-glutamate ligase
VITVWAPDGVGEVRRGARLADLLLPLVDLAEGDVVCVTSKVVSKAEGRASPGDRAEAVARETRRVVARRGPLEIVVNRLGLTMAAAGVDASNVEQGHVVLLPDDPDASARVLRTDLAARAGVNVGVLVTDTAGRTWREGQTDLAIGAAGVRVVDDHTGRVDPYGNVLAVTAPAVADELAGAAELAAGKLAGRPFTVIRGRADLVLAPGDHGPGAAALLRPPGDDLFGLGAREAVLAALAGRPDDRAVFGTPAEPGDLAVLLADLLGVAVDPDDDEIVVDADDARVRWAAEVAAYAHGWEVAARDEPRIRLRRFSP